MVISRFSRTSCQGTLHSIKVDELKDAINGVNGECDGENSTKSSGGSSGGSDAGGGGIGGIGSILEEAVSQVSLI